MSNIVLSTPDSLSLELRREIRRARPYQRAGLPPELRERVREFAVQRRAEGATHALIAKALGVSESWISGVLRGAGKPGISGFRRVRVVRPPEASQEGPVVHSPKGFRVEGLGLEGVLLVLRYVG